MTFLQLSELQASSGLKISKNYFSLFQTSDQVGRVGNGLPLKKSPLQLPEA